MKKSIPGAIIRVFFALVAVAIMASLLPGCPFPHIRRYAQYTEDEIWKDSDFTRVIEVGPGKACLTPDDVPWETISPDTLVKIHWRAEPYRSKWVISVSGSEDEPVVVLGIPGEDGALPVISGENAMTRTALNYWNEGRGVIKIGGANSPDSEYGSWIVLQNLDITSARTPYQYTGRSGLASYSDNAASVFVEYGINVSIRHCTIRDSGNGIFVAPQSSDILIHACHIYDNGIEGSIYEHNSYTEALGMIYEENRFGPLRADCPGNNLKDRSAGLVVRYNWIEGGNRELDLVDAEDSAIISGDPGYGSTFVYGNILIEPDGAGNNQIVHYGGDSGDESIYRKGTLYFYHNTVFSSRSGNTTLMRLSTNDESADCRNNIVYVTAAGGNLALLGESGVMRLRNNWLKAGHVDSHDTFIGSLYDDGGNIVGASAGFASEADQDFRLASGSACRNAGGTLAPAAIPGFEVLRQYVKHQGSGQRPRETMPDLGAFE